MNTKSQGSDSTTSPTGRGRIASTDAIRVRGVRSIDRPYPLTPTLSPWERGITAFVAILSFKSNKNLIENADGPCTRTPQRNRVQLLAGLRRCAVDTGALDRVPAVGVPGGAVLPVAGGD